MGNISIILGSNQSGKSRYAEKMVSQLDGEKVYLATMIPVTEENQCRIRKHQIQRQGIDFQTIECPYSVDKCDIPLDCIVLVEDLSNLLGNELFLKHRTKQTVLEELLVLSETCKHLIIVSISGLDEKMYEDETAFYIQQLNDLNADLVEKADFVVEMKDGHALIKKGGIL